jgi:hypothetical protein
VDKFQGSISPVFPVINRNVETVMGSKPTTIWSHEQRLDHGTLLSSFTLYA